MWKDPIVEEIQKIREAHAKKFNHDMLAIYNDLKTKEMKSEWKIVTLPLSNNDQRSEK
jgi:hypothetical protein